MWPRIPCVSAAGKRTKESIDEVRHLDTDIDSDGDARLAAVRSSDAVPIPSAILSTSPGKYQVLWQVDDFRFAEQERLLKLLAIMPSAGTRRARTATGFSGCRVS